MVLPLFPSFLEGIKERRHGMSKNRHSRSLLGKHHSKQLKAVNIPRDSVLQSPQTSDCTAREPASHSPRAGREGSLARSSAIWLALELPACVEELAHTQPQYTKQSRVGNDLTGYAGTLYVDKGYVCNGKKNRLKFRI